MDWKDVLEDDDFKPRRTEVQMREMGSHSSLEYKKFEVGG